MHTMMNGRPCGRPDGHKGRHSSAEALERAMERKVDAIAATAATRVIPAWRGHKCGGNHRTYAAMAKCMFPNAKIGIYGEGPWATLSCPKYEPKLCMYGDYSVHLHETEEAAREAARSIDDTACGGGCNRNHWKGHRIIRLELPGPEMGPASWRNILPWRHLGKWRG